MFSEYFDKWWNDGFSLNGSKTRSQTTFGKAANLLFQRQVVEAEYILQKADKWWNENPKPRFLWVHLMDPHAPYRPGYDGAVNAGLLRTFGHGMFNYLTKYPNNYNNNLPEWVKSQRKKLYLESIKKLDKILSDWIESHSDASIMIMGDHGEEFNHGLFDHARLYDETVKVPVLSNDGFLIDKGELIRQIDISPRILSELNRDIPEEWEGESSCQFQPQPMLGSLSKYNKKWVGIRSSEWKLIQTIDENKGDLGTECYNLQIDPGEKNNIEVKKAPDKLHERFNNFKQRKEINQYIIDGSFVSKIDKKTEERLKQLGYE
jgi:hypothetical protein